VLYICTNKIFLPRDLPQYIILQDAYRHNKVFFYVRISYFVCFLTCCIPPWLPANGLWKNKCY
jgi:hypothetical protein